MGTSLFEHRGGLEIDPSNAQAFLDRYHYASLKLMMVGSDGKRYSALIFGKQTKVQKRKKWVMAPNSHRPEQKEAKPTEA